jgi:NADH:ubiquinone reductase (H+-translocating)
MRRSDQTPREHIVVVGAGFGGLAAARALGRQRRRGAPIDVTLVDRRNHHTFQPLLYQVATAGLQPQDIGISLRAILRRDGITIRLGDVTGVDAAARTLHLGDGSSMGFDHLVLAAGAVTEDYGIPGVAKHAFGLKSLADATALRNHILRRFELASADPRHRHDGTLTFVIAGGGPTGVELAGALAELVDLVVRRDHPELDVDHVRIVLVEPRDRLLAGFSARAGRAALRGLAQRGVGVLLETGIGHASATEVVLTDGQRLPAHTLVWAAGVSASPLAAALGLPLGPGRRLTVDHHLRVTGTERIHAIGDIAASLDPEGRPLPQVAPVAMQQGRHVARFLDDQRHGRTTTAFRYRDKGSMATIGRAAAVAELPGGIRLTGLIAWVAWLLLHLFMLVGFKNRTSVLGSWIWNYVTTDHAARLILDQREAATAETSHGPVERSWAASG